MNSALCRRLGINAPVFQAPVGSATTPELAAAVSNAGGLGALALSWRSLDECRALIRATRRLTARPFAVNLVLEWPQFDRLRLCLDEGVRILSFFWGDPAPYLPLCRQAGAVTIHTVGSVEEARRAMRAGLAVIVAQGREAGGHVRGAEALGALVPSIVQAVAPTPVLAAGGIADVRAVAAALALGADGVWVGTRFVASHESAAHPIYKRNLTASTAADTVLDTVFDLAWPDAPHRVLRNSTVRAWEEAGRPRSPQRPGEGDTVARLPDGAPVCRYSDQVPIAGTIGDVEAMAQFAGTGVEAIRAIRGAGDITRELAQAAR
jgi:NAD(P)H-dependent flavin oxidoreductase YrpB (nitropropane dioxygenase family)